MAVRRTKEAARTRVVSPARERGRSSFRSLRGVSETRDKAFDREKERGEKVRSTKNPGLLSRETNELDSSSY